MKSQLSLLVLAACVSSSVVKAQIPSGASSTVAQAVPHVTVPYRIEDPGAKLPDIVWGLDCAWISEGNIRRGVNFAGEELIDIIRLSFQTTDAVGEDLQLSARQKQALNTRIALAKLAGAVTVNINSDQGAGVISHYHNASSASQVDTYARRWYLLIKATKNYIESNGLKVSSVSPFNEPDLTAWNQGSTAEFKAISKLIKEDPDFNGVAVCGGNTLNDDRALEWYTAAKSYLDEGNTHQLAGSFDNFANFYKRVVADGKIGVGDELHNTMECMVGSEYGLTKGIWWGTCDHTRSQFMKASRGTRLGYGEHRANWTAAAVYRHQDGSVQAFGGTSERQAVTTTYRFAALDHDVFYNGQGPMREYVMTLPGGTGYQKGQTNAETLVNIQGGDDIMPALPTEATNYRIINRVSGFALSPLGNNATSGVSLTQQKPLKSNQAQQWTIAPVDARIEGDFSYYKISNVKNKALLPDVRDWSLSDGADVIAFAGGFGDNEQWYFQYAGDGWFYIRSKHSALCLQVAPGSDKQMTSVGRNVNQGIFTGAANQQWRLIPIDVVYNADAPAAPTALTATPQPASVRLTWTAPADDDLLGFTIQRSDDGGQTWRVINRGITGTTYVDNTSIDAVNYQYRILSEDLSRNHSEPSGVATASPTCTHALIAHITADSLADATGNGNHAALYGTLSQREGHLGQAIELDGEENFIQLPATIANSRELTFSTWIYWRAGNAWQRIFDFGNDTDHYVFLCPKPNTTNRLRLGIKNGGTEQTLDSKVTHRANQWIHVAVAFAEDAITLYLNGEPVGTSSAITTRPADFRPIFNYVGRSQFASDPMLKGYIDDIRLYNYALSADEVSELYALADGIHDIIPGSQSQVAERPSVYDLSGRRVTGPVLRRGTYIIGGRTVIVR